MGLERIGGETKVRSYLLVMLFFSVLYYCICIFVNNNFFQASAFFDADNTFMDWFNCLVDFKGNPYLRENGCNYPALAVLIFKICRFGVPEYMIEEGADYLRRYQSP